MCSLILAWDVIADTPVAVAANRDEAYARTSAGPRLLSAEPKVIAPVDEAAGGTWIGVNDNGLVVAIANREDGPSGTRSRGLLVRDVLTCDTSDEARTFLTSMLGEHEYAGFHLLLVDPDDAFYVTWNGELDGEQLSAGVHVLDNDGLDEASGIPRRVRGELEPAAGESASTWVDRAMDVLTDHDLDLCRHGTDYGTVSASTITVRDDGEAPISFRYAPGPPCETAFEDATPEGYI